MNYGQNSNDTSPDYQGFSFTPGVGLAPDSINASGQSLDSSEFPTIDHDSAPLGNAALRHASGDTSGYSPRHVPDSAPSFARQSTSESFATIPGHESQRPSQAEIISLNTPPLAESSISSTHASDSVDSYTEDNPRIIRLFADGKISKRDLTDIKLAKQKLAQTGDVADFYEYWREARIAASNRAHNLAKEVA